MKNVAPVRKELGVRTIFNMIGPLANPAGVQRQLVGVWDPDLVELFAQVLLDMGAVKALVVCGEDGLDEITLAGPTLVAELKNGEVNEYTITPDQFGMGEHDGSMLKATSREASKAIVERVLHNESGPAREVVRNPQHPYTVGLLGSLPRLDQHEKRRLASIEGLPPVLYNKPEACPFAPRCSCAIERCKVENPPLFYIEKDHQAACWVDPVSGRERQ